MPTPYNNGQQNHCSSYISDIARATGQTKTTGVPGETVTYNATFTATYAIEAGECVAMVRVPRGFTVTDMALYFTTAAVDAVIGVGDPFCCGRFLGPLIVNRASGTSDIMPQGTNTCTQMIRLSKIGRTADGCGYGYTYTCDTDILLTNNYGSAFFNVGGGGQTPVTSAAGLFGGVLPAGWVAGLSVTGFADPTFTSRS